MLSHSRNNKGFTLVELVVSIAIMTVILTVVILNQSTYNDGIALTNLADEISLSISQAQAYGVGVKEFSTGSGEFSASYGLAFSLLASGSNSAYIYFADRNGNSLYDGNWTCPIGGASECLGKVNISRGNYISSMCIVLTSGSDLCDVGRVDISFTRPSTEANMLFFDTSGQAYNPGSIKGAKITVMSPKGLSRSIIIYLTGQISVQ